MRAVHKESHLIERIGWLRAAVLGANDGLISTSSLIVGVAAASVVLDLRFDCTRTDHVDPDSMLRELQRRHLRQRHLPRL